MIAGFLGLVIGSTGTMSMVSTMSVARAQETAPESSVPPPPNVAEPTPQPPTPTPYPYPGTTEGYPSPDTKTYPAPEGQQYPPSNGQPAQWPDGGTYTTPHPSGEGEERGRKPGEGQGPSEEEMKKREEEMEKRRTEEEARRLKDMKRNMKRAATEIKRMESFFARNEKKKVLIPQECKDALAKAKATIDAIQNAQTFEELEEADPDEMRDSFEQLNDCRQTVERLSRLPRLLTQVNRQITTVERNWNRMKKGAPEDAADAVAEGDALLKDLKAARDQVKALADKGEMEEVEMLLEDSVYAKFDDIQAAMRRIEAAKNAKRFVSTFNQHLRDAQRMIAKLKKLKKDTAPLEELLAKAKEQYAHIKALKVGTPEYEDAVDELASIGQEFANASGASEDVDALIGPPSAPSASTPLLTIPEGF